MGNPNHIDEATIGEIRIPDINIFDKVHKSIYWSYFLIYRKFPVKIICYATWSNSDWLFITETKVQ